MFLVVGLLMVLATAPVMILVAFIIQAEVQPQPQAQAAVPIIFLRFFLLIAAQDTTAQGSAPQGDIQGGSFIWTTVTITANIYMLVNVDTRVNTHVDKSARNTLSSTVLLANRVAMSLLLNVDADSIAADDVQISEMRCKTVDIATANMTVFGRDVF